MYETWGNLMQTSMLSDSGLVLSTRKGKAGAVSDRGRRWIRGWSQDADAGRTLWRCGKIHMVGENL